MVACRLQLLWKQYVRYVNPSSGINQINTIIWIKKVILIFISFQSLSFWSRFILVEYFPRSSGLYLWTGANFSWYCLNRWCITLNYYSFILNVLHYQGHRICKTHFRQILISNKNSFGDCCAFIYVTFADLSAGF